MHIKTIREVFGEHFPALGRLSWGDTVSERSAIAIPKGYARVRPNDWPAQNLGQDNNIPTGTGGALHTVTATWTFTIGQIVAILFASVISGVVYHETFLQVRGPLKAFIAIGLLVGLLFASGMRIIDNARNLRHPAGLEALRDAAFLWIGVISFVVFLAFSLKAGTDLSRGFVLSFVALGFGAVLISRKYLPPLIAAQQKTRAADVLVIGAKDHPALATLVNELISSGCSNPGRIELNADCTEYQWRTQLPKSLERIFAHARSYGYGDICITADGFSASQLQDITEALRVVPRSLRVIPSAQVEPLFHMPIRSVGRLYCVELQKAPMGPAQRTGKRALDLIAASLALIFVSPLLFLIAVLIKIDSRGPVLFMQRRLGYRGQPFRIFKFRTMVTLDDGVVIKAATRDDARTTRLGAWLRKTSIDELPQLLNVIRGEMSLVGPRPHAVAHDLHYSKLVTNYEVRQHVKPGITGWAQVNGLRGSTETPDSMQRRVELDLWYAKNATLWFDLKILIWTVGTVVLQRNAY